MTKPTQDQQIARTVAPLANVSLCASAVERAMNRPPHLPGMVCFYGPAGWGKSLAAQFVEMRYGGWRIQLQETWTARAILHYILETMGVPEKPRLYEMAEQVCERLAVTGRPLIIDEVDRLVNKKKVELIRDIHEGSGAVILLIGEQGISDKLARWERFHRRVSEWVQAVPTDAEDCARLRQFYHPGVEMDEDLLAKIAQASGGSAARCCLNLAQVAKFAAETGLSRVALSDWGKRPLLSANNRGNA